MADQVTDYINRLDQRVYDTFQTAEWGAPIVAGIGGSASQFRKSDDVNYINRILAEGPESFTQDYLPDLNTIRQSFGFDAIDPSGLSIPPTSGPPTSGIVIGGGPGIIASGGLGTSTPTGSGGLGIGTGSNTPGTANPGATGIAPAEDKSYIRQAIDYAASFGIGLGVFSIGIVLLTMGIFLLAYSNPTVKKAVNDGVKAAGEAAAG